MDKRKSLTVKIEYTANPDCLEKLSALYELLLADQADIHREKKKLIRQKRNNQ